MEKRVRLFAATVLFFFCPLMVHAFTAEDIISPGEGTWSNEQPLVLNVTDGSDLYYSLTSADPLTSGFMYDGPVVIDGIGSVVVHITAVSRDGTRSDFTVPYTVVAPVTLASGDDTAQFVHNITSNPIRKYISGTTLTIPSGFMYCMGTSKNPSLPGKALSISLQNKLERYVPCTVTDGLNVWRFVIHTMAAESELVSGTVVPFAIEDWTTFTYTGEKLIYQIDDSYWSADRAPVTLDRSVQHIVRWQSIEYELGNPIETYIIPPKPELASKRDDKGMYTFYIPGAVDSADAIGSTFQLGPALQHPESGTIASGMYKSITVDTFPGDDIGGQMIVGAFYDGVFQGTLSCPYHIDRQPPELPLIDSSSTGSYARNKVTLTITAEPNAQVFYAVSTPLESDTGFEGAEKATFDAVEQGTFKPYTGSSLVLRSIHDNASFFKVNAYAVDEAGNISGLSEYRVVVDEYNYYLSATGSTIANSMKAGAVIKEPDGSYGNPFTTFAQAVKAINSMEFTQLHISGKFTLAAGETSITSSCRIVGKDCMLLLPQDSYITIQGTTLEVKDCTFDKEVKNKATRKYVTDEQNDLYQKLFMLKQANVTFTNCEIIGVFSNDGILFNTEESELKLTDCGLTIQSEAYACAVSSQNSKITAEKERVTVTSETGVCFSIQQGNLALTQSVCRVIGHMGRVAELTDTKATVTGNAFNGELSTKTDDVTAVWKDVDTVLSASENEISGFGL